MAGGAGAGGPAVTEVAAGPAVTEVAAAAYVIPTDAPEADGTLAWDATTMVLATARAGGAKGIGWSYAAALFSAGQEDLARPGDSKEP